LPHVPQWSSLLLTSMQRPGPSHHRWPSGQQWPLEQSWPEVHGMSQPPQFSGSEVVSEHPLAQQVCPVVHATMQPWQLAGSFREMHAPPQHCSVPPQESPQPLQASSRLTQPPSQQRCSGPHAMPHPPQFSGSLEPSKHSPAQQTSPGPSQGSSQVTQSATARHAGAGSVSDGQQVEPVVPSQGLSQPPQWSLLELGSTHRPPQQMRVPVHSFPHAPQ
jgi:hypothetical protein